MGLYSKAALGLLLARFVWHYSISSVTPTPLCLAANKGDLTKGDLTAVQALLNSGAKPHEGWKLDRQGVLGAMTPLFVAADNGHEAVVQALLNSGANPNHGVKLGPLGVVLTTMPLLTAAEGGHEAVVKALLAAGAKLGKGLTVGPLGCILTGAPLKVAADKGHEDVVKALLASGANPDAPRFLFFRAFGATPLQIADIEGREAIAKLLREARRR